MTLKQSQVNNLHSYLSSEYSKKLNELEAERINKVKESEKYKTLLNKIERFYEEIGLDLNESVYDIENKVMTILKGWDNPINRWDIRNTMDIKIRAILSTLPQDTDFEDVIKLVEEKLQFNEIISEALN